jgi:HSP20 family molecular chaperone IbpA
VTAKDVTASYDKGILSISVPLPEAKDKAQRVTVQSSKNKS